MSHRQTLDLIRDLHDWQPHDQGGFVFHWETSGGVQIVDRWDGESLTINRSARLPASADSITLTVRTSGDE